MRKTSTRETYNERESPFFRLRSRRKLADLLGVTRSALQSIASISNPYIRRWKSKSGDSWLNREPTDIESEYYRPIDIPQTQLKTIQARIAYLLSRIAPPDYLFSPVKGRSYVDNAAYHSGSNALWFLDIADYFPSCGSNNVARFFRTDLECSPDVTAILVRLTTWNDCLPQGSPCSPILAYFASRPAWREIDRVVRSYRCKWSLYADDITISGACTKKEMVWKVKKILYRHGLKTKRSKEYCLIGRPAKITGVILTKVGTRLPNAQRKTLAELKVQRRQTRDRVEARQLDRKIAGRYAQFRQVERNVTY